MQINGNLSEIFDQISVQQFTKKSVDISMYFAEAIT